MSENQQIIKHFLENSTVDLLKGKLRKLELSTVGNKAALMLRLEEAWLKLPLDELRKHVESNEVRNPDDHIRTSDGNAVQHDAHGNDENAHRHHSNVHTTNNIYRSVFNGDDGGSVQRSASSPQLTSDNDEEHNLDAEINQLQSVLEKKRKISELKYQLSLLERDEQFTSNINHNFTFKDIENSLPSFTGDDHLSVEKWLEIFNENADAFGWDDKFKLIYAKRLMSGTAKLFLRTTVIRSWNELKQKLCSEFQKCISKAEIHGKLRMQKKVREETLHQFVLRMQGIASFSDIEEHDLIQYIIAGIPDTETNKIILYQANTINELKSQLKKYEILKLNQSSSRDSHSFKNNHSHSQKPTSNRDTHPSRGVRNFQPRIICYSCGSMNHKANECTSKVMNVGHDYSANTHHPVTSNHLIALHNEFEYELEFKFYEEKNNRKFSRRLKTLLDSGSPISFVGEQHVPSTLISYVNPNDYKFFGINKSPLGIIGQSKCLIKFNNNYYDVMIFVVRKNSMINFAVLGRDFMKKCNLKLTMVNDHHLMGKKVFGNGVYQNKNETNKNNLRNYHSGTSKDSFTNILCPEIFNIDINVENSKSITLNINENLALSVKNKIYDIMKHTWTRSPVSVEKDVGVHMEIKLIKDTSFYTSPRRLPYVQTLELRKIIDDLLKRNIIRESNSPYASPIVLVRKKNGELRLCVDYRELNKVTARDNYPLPLIEDMLDRLRGKKYFSTLDLRSGFHHVPVASESIKFTSFVTPIGQYEYLKMPFGLKNAPSVFQRYVNRVFRKLIDSGKILIFLDDFMIATEDIEEHLEILREVTNILCENGLELRYDKCKFLYEKVNYLGYTINHEGIRPNMENIKAIQEFPIPKSIREVQGFIGLCSYFRKFIKNFALHAKPLYDLLKKNVNFKFEEEEVKSFEFLKTKLSQAPLLSLYNPTSDTELHCDASSYGFGAILLQKQSDGKFHPVFYFSKRCTETESRYHSFELETLSIIYALRRFRVYLLGIKFKIVTDCQALMMTLNKKFLNPRISRWALELEDFDYKVEHRASSRMAHVDALSRFSCILTISDDDFDIALSAAQNKDPIIRSISQELDKKESPSFALFNGQVYRKVNGDLLYYVPQQMEERVIQTHHDNLCHLGAEKCYEYMRKIYWFPNMKSKIVSYIENCLKCVHHSPVSGKVEGNLHSIPKGNLPFDVIHIDHYGPLPNSGGKRYILVIVDAFTKFVKLFPVNSTKTKEVISCLENYFKYYSRPNKIISDRGTCFISAELKEFLKSNQIQHIKVATYSPHANGQVERINRILTPMFAKQTHSDNTSGWHRELTKVEFAINNTKNRSTGYSPSMLLFGMNQKGQMCDKIYEYLMSKKDIKRNLENIREDASDNIRKNQKYNKIRYDKIHKIPRKYFVGDFVMLRNINNTPGINKKFLPKYRGPYEVVKVLDNDRYLVKDIRNTQISRLPYEGICSPMNMKPYLKDLNITYDHSPED